MDVLAKSLIVLGLAFVASGLVFLLPARRKHSAEKESFEESREHAEYYLHQMREERQEF
jgi:CRISPR/Cas system CMR-associated protein Cmr5 small subunit